MAFYFVSLHFFTDFFLYYAVFSCKVHIIKLHFKKKFDKTNNNYPNMHLLTFFVLLCTDINNSLFSMAFYFDSQHFLLTFSCIILSSPVVPRCL